MISKVQAKKFLIHLFPEYKSVLSKLTLNYRKIDIGERYCYDIQYEGKAIPLIGFRIDLDEKDININTNILQILKYGYIKDSSSEYHSKDKFITFPKSLISYSLIEDYIKINRDRLIDKIINPKHGTMEIYNH